MLRLLDYVIFNALLGNHAAHGKNFSLLYGGKVPALARRMWQDGDSGFAGNALVGQIVTLIEQRSALTIRRLLADALG